MAGYHSFGYLFPIRVFPNPSYGGRGVSVGVAGTGVSVNVDVGVKVEVGGTKVAVLVEDGVGVMEGVQVGGMNWVGVMVGVPVCVGVAVKVGVRLGVSVFRTGVKERFKVAVGESVGVAVSSTRPPSGATMIATSPTQ
jgi:hypothetical protein